MPVLQPCHFPQSEAFITCLPLQVPGSQVHRARDEVVEAGGMSLGPRQAALSTEAEPSGIPTSGPGVPSSCPAPPSPYVQTGSF